MPKIAHRERRRDSRQFSGQLVAATLAVLFLLGGQLWISYRDQLRTAEISTNNIASVFGVRFDGTLRRVDADLQSIAASIPAVALDSTMAVRYAARIGRDLDARLLNMAEMSGYRIHDAKGAVVFSSSYPVTARESIADQAFFQTLRDQPDAGLVFSEVLFRKSTGQQILMVARALRDRAGRFIGVVCGRIDLEYYQAQFKSLNLGADGVVALRRSDSHVLVARSPEIPELVNRPLETDHPVVKHLDAPGHEMALHYLVPHEAVARVMSVAKLADYPYYFVVGVGRDEVLAGWWAQVKVVAILTVLLFVLVGHLLARLAGMRKREVAMLQHLAQSETQFRELAQMVPVGICNLDKEGRYTYVNDRFAEIAGRSRERLLGGAWEDYVDVEDREAVRASREVVGRPWGARVLEFRYALPGGGVRYVQGEIQPEYDAQGLVVGFLAAVTDITERKLTEADLIVAKQHADLANQTKSRFLAAASHDLRQPIQAINLFRDALAQTELNSAQRTILGFLSQSVHSLGELLYSLLDVSKLDAGQVRPQFARVEVVELFRAIEAEFASIAQRKGLRFKLFFPFRSVSLETDSRLVMSVLRNLIDNALKYTCNGGVLVGFRKRAGRGVIQVWDTGVGIETKYGDQIFEECFQVNNPARDRNQGLGLGLSIARRMAHLLRSEVRYSSRFGRGTVFEVELPLAGEFLSESVVEIRRDTMSDSAEWEPFRGWRIVVVEDDPMVAKSIQLALQSVGLTVSAFGSAELALDSDAVAVADFVVSDFTLPGMDGIRFLDTLQQRSPVLLNAVLMTGATSPERIERASSSNWPVLFKPVDLAGLRAAMGRRRVVEPA